MTKKHQQYNIPKPQEQVPQDYGISGVDPIITRGGDLIVAQRLASRFNLQGLSYDSLKGFTTKKLYINGQLEVRNQNVEYTYYYKTLNLLNPVLVNNEVVQISLGRDNSTNNVGEINFYYFGGAVTSNFISIGLYGTPTTLSVGLSSISTNGAINYAVDSEANDTYVITLIPTISALYTGMQITFKANTANTGAASLNVNGLGAKTIVKGVSTALSNNDILANMFCLVVYDGTNFVLMNPRTL